MANKKQLEVLNQGVNAWNKWREGNPRTKIDLTQSELKGAELAGADLSSVDLSSADLSGAILLAANLQNANLSGSNLRDTNLVDANLCETKLYDANLGRADITGANFRDAKLGLTVFGNVDLSKSLGLEDVVHYMPSYISTDSLKRSGGNIPIEFMRGCGLSDLDIEYSKLSASNLDAEMVTDITYKLHQLYLGGGIQYYSCFISYSGKDHKFAKTLHDDLQNNGVRCWFDLEDIKIGEPIRPTIDRQIRLRDKLLVILSENSIQSEYVGDEVEAALEEEQKNKRLVVFPIRIDDAPLNTRDDWAAKIKRRRHIGDFSNWRDKASYQKAFERLLRDLKATGGQVNGE